MRISIGFHGQSAMQGEEKISAKKHFKEGG
jgi:hypothetical protein